MHSLPPKMSKPPTQVFSLRKWFKISREGRPRGRRRTIETGTPYPRGKRKRDQGSASKDSQDYTVLNRGKKSLTLKKNCRKKKRKTSLELPDRIRARKRGTRVHGKKTHGRARLSL